MGAGVQVVIRTRPTASFAGENISVHDDRRSISVNHEADSDNAKAAWTWKYDAVLHNASQETVYQETVSPVVQSVLQGYNGTILCYGQTGAGKTFTQIGSTATYAHRGIAPRAIGDVFQYIQGHPQFEATVGVSYVEIYNDSLVDLLGSLPSAKAPSDKLELIDDPAGGTHVKGLRIERVKDEEAALNLLFTGESSRAIAKHQLNTKSTRGHAIFTVYLQIRSRVESSDKIVRCRLHLVDLAGSERLKKTDTSGEMKAESMYINRSLSYLEQVVVALGSKSRSHTPYRQSKLTHLLKDAIGGNSKTLLIANIYGEEAHLEETISTLQFAARVRAVTNSASVNETPDPALLLKSCEKQIAELKREIAMHDAIANRSRVQYEPYSEVQRAQLSAQLRGYLEHQVDDLELESVRQMRELLLSARNLYDEKVSELEAALKALTTGGGGGLASSGSVSADAALIENAELGDAVGDVAGSKGVSIGHAPDGAKPPGGLVDPPTKSGSSAPPVDSGSSQPTAVTGGDAPLGRQEAFAQYKTAEGQASNDSLIQNKALLKELLLERKATSEAVNGFKREIDKIKARLDEKRDERESQASADEAEIIDEEEYALIQSLKEVKTSYKTKYERMTQVSAEVVQKQEAIDLARQTLLADFEQWYVASFTDGEPAPAPTSGQAPVPVEDPMDEDEQFEQLQMSRVIADEPESLPFLRARKAAAKGTRKR